LISLACGAFCFIKDLAHGAFFLYEFFLSWDAFDLKFLILSTNSLVVKMRPTPILRDHNDTICAKQYLSKFQVKDQIKPLEIQIAQHHFNSKIVYKQQRTAGGMPHPKPTYF